MERQELQRKIMYDKLIERENDKNYDEHTGISVRCLTDSNLKF